MQPQVRVGLAPLTRCAFQGQSLSGVRAQLLLEFKRNPGNAAALMDVAVIDQLEGDTDAGLAIQSQALETCRTYRSFRETAAGKTLLVLAAPIQMGGNTPVDFLLERSDFNVLTHFVDPVNPTSADLPGHDVVFVAAPGDSDDCRQFLDGIEAITDSIEKPVVNAPENIARLERDVLHSLLCTSPGIRVPTIKRFSRNVLELASAVDMHRTVLEQVGDFPLVIRPVGSHAGLGLEKLNSANDLSNYLRNWTNPEFFVSEYIDYTSAHDDKFRKYRVILVGGKAFPCHMAIADQWKVWYLNADMQNDPQKRSEEAAFMDAFATEFAARHANAFDSLYQKLGLDYFGVDCAEDRDGNLVIFEADNALLVHDMDPPDVFPYKLDHMHRLFDAVEAMLTRMSVPQLPKPRNRRATTKARPASTLKSNTG